MVSLTDKNVVKIVLFVISLFLLNANVYSYAADTPEPGNSLPIVFEVVSRNINAYDENIVPEYHYFVIKKRADGNVDKNFHEVECTDSDYIYSHTEKCRATTLPDGKFLLADCFTHNSVCYSCIFVRFSSDGTQDSTFKTPFTTSVSDIVNGSPEHEIKDIKQVTIEQNETIRIEGVFISPLIGWSSKQAETDIGDRSGKRGIVLLKKDGLFDSFRSNDNH